MLGLSTVQDNRQKNMTKILSVSTKIKILLKSYYEHSAIDKNVKHLLLLTTLNAVTGHPDFDPLLNHTAEAAAKCIDKYWFCCYPWLKKVVFDDGSEFVGYSFQEHLKS